MIDSVIINRVIPLSKLNYNIFQFGMRNSECGINGRYAPDL